jgi:broad specificity phosphatase PhoE
MAEIYLVRHAQASLGAANYDQLSLLGHQQARVLGTFWHDLKQSFDLVICGTLQRHRETLEGIQEGMGMRFGSPDRVDWAGLNEYDSHAVIACAHPDLAVTTDTEQGYKAHFRALREGLSLWMEGQAQPTGMPRYSEFVHGVMSALVHAQNSSAQRVLMISSGGPISTALGEILGLEIPARIEMNLRLRNTAVNEIVMNRQRLSAVAINQIAHLQTPAYLDWVTYA